jgi:transposase
MTPAETQKIRELRNAGLSMRAIASELRVHRRKVRRALTDAGDVVKKPRTSSSKLDSHRGWLLARLEQYPMINAHALHNQLLERGYDGSYSLTRKHVAMLRPKPRPVYRTLAFAPGEAAQADWGEWRNVDVKGGRRRLSFFVMVLCHSRMLYAEMAFGQSMEFWLQAHRNAFEFFGGVPERVIVDNCKTAVTRAAGHSGGAEVNSVYQGFANRCGFNVSVCAPYRPESKGIVENAVGYVRTGFLAGREAAAPEVINPLLREWLEKTANRRKHGTTGLVPAEAHAKAERRKMRPLPETFPPCCISRTAAADSRFRVSVCSNKYSVPSGAASKKVRLELHAERVVLRDEGEELLADHRRCFDFNQEIADPEHDRAFILASKSASERTVMAKFLTLGSASQKFLDGLREKVPNWREHARQILDLERTHGRESVARALEDSAAHHAFSAAYIHNMLELRKRHEPYTGTLHVPRREDLLALEVKEPDMTLYERDGGDKND